MKIKTKALLPILAIATACGGSVSSTDPQAATTNAPVAKALPTNQQIVAMVYDSEYSVPVDFFVDERASMTRSYTVHHVLDQSSSFERCTDDLVVAQAWEQADNESRAVNGYYVTSYENDRYFEFARELSFTEDVSNIGDITSPGFARVFKCGHTNRDGVDRQLLSGYAGRLNPDTLDAQVLRDFTEYLWQFRFFNVSARKIIESNAQSLGATLQHTLLLALVTNQGADRCDLVEVVEWRFSADPADGEVQRTYDTVRSFEAWLVDGEASICQD